LELSLLKQNLDYKTMGFRGKWFVTKDGSLIDLDFFYAFIIHYDNNVMALKDRNEPLSIGSFKTRNEAQKYIELIKQKIMEDEAKPT